jgi:hypothetical protein
MLPIADDPTWYDRFWDSPFGQFLTTPTDIVPSGIALAALLLGVVNFALRGGPSLRVTAITSSIPTIGTDSRGEPYEYHEVEVGIVNRGARPAHDVRVELRLKGARRQRHRQEIGALATDEKKGVSFTRREWKGLDTAVVIVRWRHGRPWGVRTKIVDF